MLWELIWCNSNENYQLLRTNNLWDYQGDQWGFSQSGVVQHSCALVQTLVVFAYTVLHFQNLSEQRSNQQFDTSKTVSLATPNGKLKSNFGWYTGSSLHVVSKISLKKRITTHRRRWRIINRKCKISAGPGRAQIFCQPESHQRGPQSKTWSNTNNAKQGQEFLVKNCCVKAVETT